MKRFSKLTRSILITATIAMGLMSAIPMLHFSGVAKAEATATSSYGPTATSPSILNVPGASDPIQGSWRELGPRPENCGVYSPDRTILLEVACSGRVDTIAFDPAHPGTLYLGGATGGVWKSNDNGRDWNPMSDDQPSLSMGSIAVDPSGTVYAGTGDADAGVGSGAGILKSTDGGQTWVQLGEGSNPVFGRAAITRIAINRTNSNYLLAAAISEQNSPRGVFKSRDGGNSWQLLPTVNSDANDLVVDPTNPQIVYVADGGIIYKTIDGGLTWNPISGGSLGGPACCARINLSISAAAPTTLFALTAFPSLWKYQPSSSPAWSQIDISGTSGGNGLCGGQCWYDLVIAADPTNANTLYIGGFDLWLSSNGGATWTDIGGYHCCVHSDMHTLVFDPSNHNHILVGNDGGIWSATAGTTCAGGPLPTLCWTDLNQNLELTQFYSVAASPTDPYNFIGGAQDNGVVVHNCNGVQTCDHYSLAWSRVTCSCDGGWTAYDPINPSIMYYVNNGALFRSDDGGVTWTNKASGLPGLAIDPSIPAQVYATDGSQLFRSENRGDDGFNLQSPLFKASTEGRITAIGVDGQYVYVGTQLFWASTDGATSFHRVDNGLFGRQVGSIAVNHADPKKVAVSLQGFFSGHHIFLTNDAGGHWSDISFNIPDLDAYSLVWTGQAIFAGTPQGVYMAFPNLANSVVWTRVGRGLPNSYVNLSLGAGGSLVAGTFGRGAWIFRGGVDPTRIASLRVPLGGNGFYAGVIDSAAGFAYFGTGSSPGVIVKVRLYDFKIVDSLTLAPNSGEDYLVSATIDPANHFAYFGSASGSGTTTTPAVIRIDLSNFSPSGVTELGPFTGVGGFYAAVIDTPHHFAYFGAAAGASSIGTSSLSASILRVDLTNFFSAGTRWLALKNLEGGMGSAVIDTANHFAYFGLTTSPGEIAKVDLSTFTEVNSALVLGTGENGLYAAGIDTVNGFAYFAASTSASSPDKIVKINLSTFTESASLTLSTSSNGVMAGLVDTTTDFAYFATFSAPSTIAQIRLSDFTVSGSLTLKENAPTSAVIDAANGFAYFGSSGPLGFIVKVLVKSNIGSPPFTSFQSVVTGVGGGLYSSVLSGSWNSWTYLGGSSPSPPGLCATSPVSIPLKTPSSRSMQLVGRGDDNGIYHMSLTDGIPSGVWDSPGGLTIDTPTCAILDNNIYVVVRGGGDELWYTLKSLAGGVWHPWVDLGRRSPSAPLLIATPSVNSERLDLVVRGEDDGIYHMGFPSGNPNLWDSPGGATPSSPSIASDGINLYVAVRGEDNGIYYDSMSFSTGLWRAGWTPLNGATPSSPALAVDGAGTLHIVVQGMDNRMYHKSLPPGGIWSNNWDSPGGGTLATPSLAVYGSDLAIVVEGGDHGIWYNSLVLGTWQGWIPLNGATSMRPGLVSNSQPIP